MAKLSQQFQKEEGSQRLSRTQRVKIKQENIRNTREQQKIAIANEKLSNATFDNYEEIYYQIDPKYRENLMTPSEFKSTKEYQDYQEDKKKDQEIRSWQKYFDAYDRSRRGKPFVLGLSPSDEDIRKFGEVKKALTTGNSNIPSYVVNAYRGQMTKDFSRSPSVFGVDRGETRKIITIDQNTGELKNIEQYSKEQDKDTGKWQLRYGSLNQDQIKKIQEEQLKEQQDKLIQDWQDKNKTNIPYSERDYSVVVTEGEGLPFGYGGQGTVEYQIQDNKQISVKPRSVLTDQDQTPKQTPISDFVIGSGKPIKSVFNYIDQRINWDFTFTGSPNTPTVKLISFGKKEEESKTIFDIGSEKIDIKSQAIEEKTIGKENIENLQEDLDQKYSRYYQTSFEQKYYEDIIRGNISFEDAEKKFAGSDTAKKISEDYQKEYGEGYADLQKNVGYGGIIKGGVQQVGLGIGKFALTSFSTPTRSAITLTAFYGGVKGYQAISKIPYLSPAITTGLTVYGTSTFLDQDKTYTQRASGLVTAVISGSILGYSGYKSLRFAKVSTAKIKAPARTLRSSEVVGSDQKILLNDKTLNKVVYSSKKISQTAQAGRRTIVTTRWRYLSNKYLGTNFKNIYEGIPSRSGGSTYLIKGSRFNINAVKTKSDYQKAIDVLKRSGYTESQAKQTLRLYRPTVTEDYLKGELFLKGKTASGQFSILRKRKVIDLKDLGIKTRGGGTKEYVFDVQREIKKLKTGQQFVAEVKGGGVLTFNQKGQLTFIRNIQQSRSIVFGGSGDAKQVYEYLGRSGGQQYFRTASAKDVRTLSFEQRLYPSVSRSTRVTTRNAKLIRQIIDLRDGKYSITPASIKKTPFSKTFQKNILDQLDDVVDQTDDVSRIIDKLDDVTPSQTTPTSQVKEQSQFYGKGLYERTDDFGSQIGTLEKQQQLNQLQQVLRSPVSTQFKVDQLKEIIQVKTLTQSPILQLGQLSALKTDAGVKVDGSFKTDLKIDTDLLTQQKIDIKTDALIKSATALRTPIKTDLKAPSLLNVDIPISARTPSITPTPTTPFPPLLIAFLKAKQQSQRRSKGSKGVNEYAYLPDFTSRAIGLDPEILTKDQASKRVKKVLTGLEIRRGITIK